MKEQTEVRHTDPVTGGQKGEKPCRMDLFPAPFMWEVGEVYGMGAKKYNDHNWAKGYKWSLSTAAMLRHLFMWLRGEKLDKESGLHHLAHVAWHCGTLFTFEENALGTDDRLPPGKDLDDGVDRFTITSGDFRDEPEITFTLNSKGGSVSIPEERNVSHSIFCRKCETTCARTSTPLMDLMCFICFHKGKFHEERSCR